MGAGRAATTTPQSAGATSDLSTRLGMLERDLRHTWVSLLDVSGDAASRVGDAGRLIHRAKSLLDDTSLIH
ncbi:MAG: hypothetical protein ACRD2C_27610 [Acidimicrobiales bacterium]